MWLETDRCCSDGLFFPMPLTFYAFSATPTHRRRIAGHECQRRKVGYGPWIVLEKAGRVIIGFGGLYDDPFDAGWGIEVSYHLAPPAWGNGYATELTKFCLQMAHDELGFAEVRAFAHPDNGASRRVLDKAGFEKLYFVQAMNRYLYVHRHAKIDSA
jgi:[ribosomal protein S5]-alanine N-acetyltransferase